MFGAHAIANGDVLACLKDLPSNEFDAVLSDPPYGLSFMGKRWDYDVPSVEVFREILRVLKPGAPLLCFSGTRTFHRMAVNIEDAGFDLHDCLMWLYGKGFPKSLDISKAIDKRRDDTGDVRIVCRALRAAMDARGLTAARLADGFGMHSRMVDHWAARDTDSQPNLPTWEQWERLDALLGPFDQRLHALVWTLNGRKGQPGDAWQDAEVVGTHKGETPGLAGHRFSKTSSEIKAPATALAQQWDGYGTALKPAWEPIVLAFKPHEGTYAANVTKYGTGALAIDACRIATEEKLGRTNNGREAYDPSSYCVAPTSRTTFDQSDKAGGRWPANLILDEEAGAMLDASTAPTKSVPFRENNATGNVLPLSTRTAGGYADAGGPSRFFYSAKVSTREREFGCEGLAPKSAAEMTDSAENAARLESPRTGAGRTGGARNHHPTLKPLALAKWLARLIMPPTENATLLVPYSGAGSEMIGALQAGWPMVFGIEGQAEYVEIAHARIAAWAKEAA